MRISLPSGRLGRLLAIGITLTAIVLAWVAIATPLSTIYAEAADAMAQRRILLRRMSELADALPALRAQVPLEGSSGIPAVPVLDGATDAVAGAALQQSVQEMAAAAGAVLASTENLPATPVPHFRRIGLRVSLSAPWPVLVGLLQAIEQASPRMLVDDLQIRGVRMLTPPAQPPLDAGFTVLAFRADAPAAPAGGSR